MGFTFDDTDTKGVATPLAEMRRLIAEQPENQEAIFPYIGGEEVNDQPMHLHHRYVINFGERPEDECRTRWPSLMQIVEERVRPERAKNKRETRRRRWWQFGETTPALFRAIAGLDRVLVAPRTSKHIAFAFLPTGMVFSENLVVFVTERLGCFGLLQARLHEVWVRSTSSTLEDRIGYRPSDCFETFPFPEDWESNTVLEAVGSAYYEHRARLMVAHDEGLTKTYNRFHDPDERDVGIGKLRELHSAMDRAVLDAYGWSDIATDCDFFLEYDDEEDESTRRKRPWRYHWPSEVHDEVLARLIELNAERAAAEERAGLGAAANAKRRKRAPVAVAQTEHLF